ncbi:MAG: hypothetical protein JO112_01965 [Planctomycetes bacterium]|nr:hypothetical protein [Planctomycetota bacterium]
MPPTATYNARATGDLQRRYRRLTAIFYGGLVAIPLGLFCPCGLAALLRPWIPEWSPTVALSGFLLPLLGLAAALLVLGDRARCRRSLALARLADSWGLRFTYQPARAEFAFLDQLSFHLFRRQPWNGSGVNLIEGTFKRRTLRALDYSFLHLVVNRPVVSNQTVVMFPQGWEGFPNFALLPQAWSDQLRRLLQGTPEKTFAVPEEEEFNQRFLVAGERRNAILACLSAEVIDLFLEDRELALELSQGVLVVYRRDQVIPAEGYESFLLQACRVAQELEKTRTSE